MACTCTYTKPLGSVLTKCDECLLAGANALDACYAAAETGPAEAYEHDLRALVQAAQITVSAMSANTQFIALTDFQRIKDGLKQALDQFEPWLEAQETPAQMGWVGKDGQP